MRAHERGNVRLQFLHFLCEFLFRIEEFCRIFSHSRSLHSFIHASQSSRVRKCVCQFYTEADDLMGCYAMAACERPGMEVVLATNDKDLYQLVGPCVKVYTTTKADLVSPKDAFALLAMGFPATLGASVVPILFLAVQAFHELSFRVDDDHAAAFTAVDEAGVRCLVLLRSRPPLSPQNLLRALELLTRHYRLMEPVPYLAIPFEFAIEEGVIEELIQS